MKNVTKTFVKFISATAMVAGLANTANAGMYYVYKKAGTSTCDISTKSPDKYNRGSSYQLVGTDTSRSGVKKQGARVGCSSF